MALPACQYRLPSTVDNVYYCLSSLVHSPNNFVPGEVCLGCDMHSVACEALPRPAHVPTPNLPSRKQWDVGVVEPPAPGTWQWAYGVTVAPRPVPTIERTLASLAAAGFPKPHIFADGDAAIPDGFPTTRREIQVGAWPNWILAAHELYQRDPYATAYALFQDDILLARNVRQFLETTDWPRDGYLNLYTARQNGHGTGWFRPPRKGHGALALVFCNEAFRSLLLSEIAFDHRTADFGHKRIDVTVADALARARVAEYIHGPSLVQHQHPRFARVPARNSTLGHNFSAVAVSFPGEQFDCERFVTTVPRHVVTTDRPRIGLVGFNTASGIGSCNRDICTHLPVVRWLVVRHRVFPTLDVCGDTPVTFCTNPADPSELVKLCKEIDVLITVETEFIYNQTQIARRLGVVTVCVPMLEWLPERGWPAVIDIFLCPTREAFRTLAAERPGRCQELLWPVDTQRFSFRERQTCERFVFINGHGGHAKRKGGDVVRQTLAMTPSVPAIVYDQSNGNWPHNCDVRKEVPSREMLYKDGDVLLLPARFNGIGLEQLEAMASGLPVIATNAAPMNESPCLELIDTGPPTVAKSTRARPTPVHSPKASHLAELLRKWHRRDISQHSRAARQFAMSRSWQTQAALFLKALRE